MNKNALIQISRISIILFIPFLVIAPLFITYILPLTPYSRFAPALTTIQDGIIGFAAIFGTFLAIKINGSLKNWKVPLLLGILLFLAPQIYLYRQYQQETTALFPIIRFFVLFYILLILANNFRIKIFDLELITTIFCVFFLLSCVYDLIVNHEYFTPFSLEYIKQKIFQSFFMHSNRFACLLGITIILSTVTFWLSKKLFFIITPVFLFAYLVLTGSRGSMLMVLVFLFVFYLSFWKDKNFKKYSFIFIDLILVGLILWQFDFFRKFVLAFARIDQGVTGREDLWIFGWKQYLSDNLYLGKGLTNNLETLIQKTFNILLSAHNGYITVLYAGGIILTCLYGYVFFTIMKQKTPIRDHFTFPFLISASIYTIFESTFFPFFFHPLSNYFTVCLISLPLLLSQAHEPSI
ncbi:MAG: O-antigen ligase family protein [Flexilinea sp.]